MELYGREYVIDHVLSFWKQEQKERKYRAYVTDALRLIGENTAKLSAGSYLVSRWVESNETKETPKSGDDIAKDIINRAGLKTRGDENGDR